MRRTVGVLLAGCVALAGVSGCEPSDPTRRILDERDRWQVVVLSWATGDDGSVRISLRVSGPVSSFLETLTIRIDLVDASEVPYYTHWEVIDVASIERGTPTDLLVMIDPQPQAPEAISMSMMPEPTAEERPHIVELSAGS